MLIFLLLGVINNVLSSVIILMHFTWLVVIFSQLKSTTSKIDSVDLAENNFQISRRYIEWNSDGFRSWPFYEIFIKFYNIVLACFIIFYRLSKDSNHWNVISFLIFGCFPRVHNIIFFQQLSNLFKWRLELLVLWHLLIPIYP